jgi:hypothetical protein
MDDSFFVGPTIDRGLCPEPFWTQAQDQDESDRPCPESGG